MPAQARGISASASASDDVVEAGRQDLAADPLGDLLRGAGDAEAVGEVVGRAAQGLGDVAARERLVDRLDLAERHAVALDQRRRHRRQVEGGLQAGGAARGVGDLPPPPP